MTMTTTSTKNATNGHAPSSAPETAIETAIEAKARTVSSAAEELTRRQTAATLARARFDAVDAVDAHAWHAADAEHRRHARAVEQAQGVLALARAALTAAEQNTLAVRRADAERRASAEHVAELARPHVEALVDKLAAAVADDDALVAIINAATKAAGEAYKLAVEMGQPVTGRVDTGAAEAVHGLMLAARKRIEHRSRAHLIFHMGGLIGTDT